MNREQILETIARAMCESVYPACDWKIAGQPWPSTWEREREAFIAKATAALAALEAAGLIIMPAADFRAVCKLTQEIAIAYVFGTGPAQPPAQSESALSPQEKTK